MALTLTKILDSEDVSGRTRSVRFTATGDASYPAGGYAITPASVGLRVIDSVGILGGNPASGRLVPYWDRTNQKLMFFYPTGGSPASPAALADPVGATGATAVTSSAATLPLVPGQGKEVAAATNLTTVTVELLINGDG